MITDASKAVVLAGDQDEARAAWSGQAGVDATLQGTRLSKGPGGEERWIEAAPPARSLSMVLVAEVRGRRRNAPRQAGPAGPPTTGISFGLTTVTLAWVTGRLCIASAWDGAGQ